MKQYTAELNTVAVDVALEALFGTKARDDAKRVYELINAAMIQTWSMATAAEAEAKTAYFNTQIDQLVSAQVDSICKAERIGYDKGHAAALFAQAVERLNTEAAEVSPALAPQAPQEETALVNAGSALG